MINTRFAANTNSLSTLHVLKTGGKAIWQNMSNFDFWITWIIQIYSKDQDFFPCCDRVYCVNWDTGKLAVRVRDALYRFYSVYLMGHYESSKDDKICLKNFMTPNIAFDIPFYHDTWSFYNMVKLLELLLAVNHKH